MCNRKGGVRLYRLRRGAQASEARFHLQFQRQGIRSAPFGSPVGFASARVGCMPEGWRHRPLALGTSVAPSFRESAIAPKGIMPQTPSHASHDPETPHWP